MADDLCDRYVDVGVMYLACSKPALHEGEKHRTALTTMAGRRVWIEWEMELPTVAEIINETGA